MPVHCEPSATVFSMSPAPCSKTTRCSTPAWKPKNALDKPWEVHCGRSCRAGTPCRQTTTPLPSTFTCPCKHFCGHTREQLERHRLLRGRADPPYQRGSGVRAACQFFHSEFKNGHF